MRWRTTIIVDVLAVLGVAAMIVHMTRGPGAGTARLGPQRLFTTDTLPVDAVDRLTLRRAADGDRPFVFARRGSEWQQVEPFEHPMDPYSLRQFVVLAADLEAVDRLDPFTPGDGLTPASLMLDPPAAELTCAWPDGTVTLRLGRKGIAGRAYLQVEGDPAIYVTSQALHERALDMDPREWRDRRIFRGAAADADRIEWSAGEQLLVIEREGRVWTMREPVATRLNAPARDEFLEAIGRARHNGFILDEPDDLAEFGLDAPAGVVAVIGADSPGGGGAPDDAPRGQRLVIGDRIGASGQDRYGMIEGRPVVIRLSEAVLGALFPPPARLIDPTGSGVDPADVKALRISTDQEEFLLERDLERWIAPERAGREVPADLVNELLEQLARTAAPELRLAPYPYEQQVAVVTFLGFGGRPLDTVRIARDPETGKWSFENGDNVLRVFPAALEPRLTMEDYGLR